MLVILIMHTSGTEKKSLLLFLFIILFDNSVMVCFQPVIVAAVTTRMQPNLKDKLSPVYL